MVPPGVRWSLPIVELALLAAKRAGRGRIELVTAERAPLEVFGPTPSRLVAELLARAGVRLHTGREAFSFDGVRLWVGLGEALPCDAAFAGATLEGPAVPGLPHAAGGFLPVDDLGVVRGTGVFAAGDATTIPHKQGGVATQMADVVALGIAARAGADVHPAPLRPVLRAMLATPAGPLFLRRDTAAPDGEVSRDALWWPPAKVAAPHLAGYLAERRRELSRTGSA